MAENHENFGRQLELEQEMQGRGIKRYWDALRAAREDDEESRTIYGQILLRETVKPFGSVIHEYIQMETGRAGRPHAPAALLKRHKIDPEVAAFLTLKVAFNGLAKMYSVQNIADQIGAAIETEARFAFYEGERPAFYDKIIRNQKERGRPLHHTKRVVIAKMRKDGVEWPGWPVSERVQLGKQLIDLYITAADPPIFQYYEPPRTKRTKTPMYKLTATPAISEWIDKCIRMNEALTPAFMPCVVEPKPWTTPFGGGFYTLRKDRPLTIVKTKKVNYLQDLKYVDMPVVYGAINTLQNTAWKVNQRVLDVLSQVWDQGGATAGLPSQEKLPAPQKLHPQQDDAADLVNAVRDRLKGRESWRRREELVRQQILDAGLSEAWEAHKLWRQQASTVHDSNHRAISKQIQVSMTIRAADKVRNEERIYFPYQMDFRGRVYSICEFLSPQGPDYAKALLTFAEGAPITDQTAEDWLAIHGANVFGYDKAGLRERVHWVAENEQAIIDVATDPLSNRWWCDADKPWQFLAFCFEWSAFKNQGWGYASSLPIALDGTCNGLQHFSAMLRDHTGGEATNLVPADKPQDIYQRVADVTIDYLKAELLQGEAVYAQRWLDYGINRKTTKRPVMVLPYGGTLYACRSYVKAHVEERTQAGAPQPFGDGLDKACDYLAKIIWLSISDVVVAARHAMAWLQKAARSAAKENVPLNWVTPAGFPALQFYSEEKIRVIDTRMNGRLCRIKIREETDKLDVDRQVQGISPNFVHSLDAAALMLTVCDAADTGITSFAMVHDSYGTMAAHTQTLATTLRSVFVRMYEKHDVLAEFKDQVEATITTKLDPVPPVGDLDISKVLESEFFFA